jgi:serine protease Do
MRSIAQFCLSGGRCWARMARITAFAVCAGVTPFLVEQVALSTPAQAEYGPASVAPLAKRLTGAVVNISTTQVAKGPQGVPLPQVPKGSPFEDFFEEFFNRRGGPPQADRKVSSLGSGFVIDGKQGLIVTNNHVIDGADEIVVNFADGSKLTVEKVLGRDTKADIALLKVSPAKPLVDVSFGSSAELEVGDWVMAIGNPFGLGGSVSMGIISAKSRDINSGVYDDYLQTDAAINKGNSGGPLFNMKGEVVGVNTAIISPTGGSIGIGFAVPSDTVAMIVDHLQEFGVTRRGWLGVKLQTVSEDVSAALGIDGTEGALVADVTPGSPADVAGITAGDVILKFDGKDVATAKTLPKIVAQTPIGKPVAVEIRRGDKRSTVTAAIGLLEEEATAQPAAVQPESEAPPPQSEVVLGLKLSELTAASRATHGFDDKIQGVLVEDVEPGSLAAQKGLKAGDLIVEAGQQSVTTPADVVRGIEAVRKAGRRAVLMRVENNKGDLRFVAVPLT